MNVGIWSLSLLLMVFLGTVAAVAYDEGGHHYTLTSIFYEGHPAPSVADPYKVVEAFCAYLPDLSMELDATHQRQHVLWYWSEWTWGLLTQCNTNRCRHMVATHLFLHALTGTDVQPVRAAAEQLIDAIDVDLKHARKTMPVDTQRLVNLACERGFADHLLGDTFAHSRMHVDDTDPDRLYPPGLGHWKDMHAPDRMLSRTVRGITRNPWEQWVDHATNKIDGRGQGTAVKALAKNVPPDKTIDTNYFGEHELVAEMKKYVKEDSWQPYKPSISEWKKLTMCDRQIAVGPADRKGGTGVPPIQGVKPQCEVVWESYLKRALSSFSKVPMPYGSYTSEIIDATGQLKIRLKDGQ